VIWPPTKILRSRPPRLLDRDDSFRCGSPASAALIAASACYTVAPGASRPIDVNQLANRSSNPAKPGAATPIIVK